MNFKNSRSSHTTFTYTYTGGIFYKKYRINTKLLLRLTHRLEIHYGYDVGEIKHLSAW